jgi:hypothetical protein
MSFVGAADRHSTPTDGRKSQTQAAVAKDLTLYTHLQ